MARWVNNEAWQEREIYNRAPRSALIECEPSHCTRAMRAIRATVRFVLIVGLLTIIIVGMFKVAQP